MGWGSDRIRGGFLVLLAMAALAVAALAFTALPQAREEERAFRAAAPCEGLRPSSCMYVLPAEVVENTFRQKQGYRLTLDGAPRVDGTYEIDSGRPLVRLLKPGDELIASFWGTELVRLSDGGFTQTLAGPTDEPEFLTGQWRSLTAFALAMLLAGICLLMGATRRWFLLSTVYWLLLGPAVVVALLIPGLGPPSLQLEITLWSFAMPLLGIWAWMSLRRRAR